MINVITTEYTSKSKIEFIQDDDKEFNWLSEFDSLNYDRFFIVIDSNVKEIWGKSIFDKLKIHKKDIITLKVESIEETKSIHFYQTAIDFFENNKCSRYDLVIAIGGGIVLDLVSFVVSTFMRGLPLFMIPTTLIGQTDASTAGKTCLNSKNSKNLLGTFYYPEIVYNNLSFLETNTNRFLRQGFSESFKYGLLNSQFLIDKLIEYHQNRNKNVLKEIIDQTIKSRIEVRQIDALASNLGHTFGHAIERMSNYQVLHGDAISVGTVMALNYSVHIGVMDNKVKDNIVDLMKKLGLNIYIDKKVKAKKLVQLMLLDKKSSSLVLNLVLIKNIARPYIENNRMFCKSEPEDVILFLKNFLKSYEYKIDDCHIYLKNNLLSY